MQRGDLLGRMRTVVRRFSSASFSTDQQKSFLLDPAPSLTRPTDPRDPAESTELRTNEAAKSLLSPIRICQVTRLRLPLELLIPFVCVRHPTLLEDWIMPDFQHVGSVRCYVFNSKRVLKQVTVRDSWRKFPFGSSGDRQRRVWRPDMIACIERDMARHAPHLKLED